MRNKLFFNSLSGIIGGLGIQVGLNAQQPKQDLPNILFVLTDDHSAPHVGCYGNQDIKTPNLDKFASEAMRFTRMYTTCPQSVPSRASIMTGRSAVAIQMTRFSNPLPREYKTIPEYLRQKNYYTGVAGRSYHLDGSRMPQALEDYKNSLDLATFKYRVNFLRHSGNHDDNLRQYYEFLDSLPKGKNFFLQLCFHDPHRKLDSGAIAVPHDPAKLHLPPQYPDTKLVRTDLARYYDEISRFDQDFKKVLDELEKRGLSKNTIVVFMGDNGASQFRGKGTLYEYGLNVPLIIRWPGKIKPGIVSDVLLSGEDLAPTFVEASGQAINKEITGKSFLKVLMGQNDEIRQYAFAERGAHGSSLPWHSSNFDLTRCIITKKYKLIYNALWQLPYNPVDFNGDPFWKELIQLNKEGKLSPLHSKIYFSATRPMFELFDLEKDPFEFDNLYGKPEYKKLADDLKLELSKWMMRERDYLPLPFAPEEYK